MRIEIELDPAEVTAGLVIRISQDKTTVRAETQAPQQEDQDAGPSQAPAALVEAEAGAETEAEDAGPAPSPDEE